MMPSNLFRRDRNPEEPGYIPTVLEEIKKEGKDTGERTNIYTRDTIEEGVHKVKI